MRSIGLLMSAVSIALMLAGCTTGHVKTGAIEPRQLGREFIEAEHAVSQDKTAGRTVMDVPEEITLRDALALALSRNPELKAFSYAVRAAEARALQAGLRPNPELGVEIEEFDRAGEGYASSEMAISLGQLIELGGKRKWRRQVAETEGELAAWDYEERRLSVFAETAKRFTQAIAAERRFELAKSTVDLARNLMTTVELRVEAGKEPKFHISKAVAEFELAQLEALEAKSNVAVSRKTLASMWASDHATFRSIEGSMDALARNLPSIETVKSYLPQNPKMARRDAELRLRRAALASEKATRIPDMEVSLGFLQYEEDGTDALAFGVGFPLPIFDRNQGGITAAKYELAKAEMEMVSIQTAMSVELAEIYAGLVTAQKKATILREKVLPSSEKAFTAASEGYKQGKFGYIDVLDAQRSLFDARAKVIDALTDYHESFVELEQLTGTPLGKLYQKNGEE